MQLREELDSKSGKQTDQMYGFINEKVPSYLPCENSVFNP